jgi:hypothetical protein
MTILNIGNMQLSTPGHRENVKSREFNAPKRLVYEAFTKPELLKQWLGVHNGWKLTLCEIDLRPGGKYRYGWEGRENMKMSMGGVYREIVVPERKICSAWAPVLSASSRLKIWKPAAAPPPDWPTSQIFSLTPASLSSMRIHAAELVMCSGRPGELGLPMPRSPEP